MEVSVGIELTDSDMRALAAAILLQACDDYAGGEDRAELAVFFYSEWAEWLISLLPGFPCGAVLWRELQQQARRVSTLIQDSALSRNQRHYAQHREQERARARRNHALRRKAERQWMQQYYQANRVQILAQRAVSRAARRQVVHRETGEGVGVVR